MNYEKKSNIIQDGYYFFRIWGLEGEKNPLLKLSLYLNLSIYHQDKEFSNIAKHNQKRARLSQTESEKGKSDSERGRSESEKGKAESERGVSESDDVEFRYTESG